MERRTRLMEIVSSERASYVNRLRSVYGAEILTNDMGLQTAYQRSCETVRHRLNGRVQCRGREMDSEPRRLLVSVTQQCTFECTHCWVFGSPAADCFLGLDEMDAIHRHTSAGHPPRWTVSGGEFFTLPHYAEALNRYPIDCIYSNGFWGYPDKRCGRYVARIASALEGNRYIRDRVSTLILSYDRYHAEAAGKHLPLAGAIANIVTELYHVLPQIQLRISHTRSSPEDAGYRDVIDELKKKGFSVSQDRPPEHNGSIITIFYRYQMGDGAAKGLFVDTYPMTHICRALLHYHTITHSLKPACDPIEGSPLARYPYAVGPDGGVGLYRILYAPPVPYCLGDLVYEPWAAIAERVARDPIAAAMEAEGMAPIVSFLDRYYPDLMSELRTGTQMVQQFLYLALLDPERRLLLNAYLLLRSLESGCSDEMAPDLGNALRKVLETTDPALRGWRLWDFYGRQSRESTA